MKCKITLLLFFVFFATSYAEKIDSLKALKVASNFFLKEKAVSSHQKFKQVKLFSREKSTSSSSAASEQPPLYILNNTEDGFVIVSGNDKVKPILAYSLTGKVDPSNIPPALKEWIKWKENEINNLPHGSAAENQSITAEWTNLQSDLYVTSTEISSTEPLIKTLWGQGVYYNDMCPFDTSSDYSNNRVPVGCVATAMAQVMKYWEYPETGTGSHSYTHATYGLQTANFGTTTYDWVSMPKYATTTNTALANISYHCGVSVNMGYGPDGSSSSQGTASQSLVTYFKYKNTLSYIRKTDYTITAWNNLIKADIDNYRPVLLRGNPSDGSSGHAYICDGYTVDNYFHINWGWNGSFNGYFLFDDLTPGSSDYSYNQYATVGIQPSGNSCAVYPATISLTSASSSNSSFRIVSNASWAVSDNQTWLDLSASNGSGCTQITTTANSLNNTGINRTATITISVAGLASKTVVVTQLPSTASLANLTAYKPSTWSDKIVISNTKGTNTDNAITNADSVYLDFAFVNNGAANASSMFYCWIAYDSLTIIEGIRSSLAFGYYSSSSDNKLGRLTVGTHKIKMLIDPLNEISETNENDNVYIKTFTVVNSSTPYLSLSATTLSLDYKSSSKPVTITSNTDWTISSDQTWLIPSALIGTGNGIISFLATENPSSVTRTAIIKVSGTNVSSVTIAVSQVAGLPNLIAYKPSAWSDKIVVSNKSNTTIDNIIFDTDSVIVDYSLINNGNKKTQGTFYSKLYLNDVYKAGIIRTDTLGSNWYAYSKDVKLNKLAAGNYELKLVVDETNTIFESNETDNTYSKLFTVYNAALSLSANPEIISLPAQTGGSPLEITSIGNWTISNVNSWISISSMSGSGNSSVAVTVEANPNISGRSGKFTISNAATSKEVTVNQSGTNSNIEISDKNIFRISPNPVLDELNVIYANASIKKLTIRNSVGITLFVKENCGEKPSYNVKSIPRGYYILTIEVNNLILNCSFFKQ